MRDMKEMHVEESDVEYTPRKMPSDEAWEKFSSYWNDAEEMAICSCYENLTSPLAS